MPLEFQTGAGSCPSVCPCIAEIRDSTSDLSLEYVHVTTDVVIASDYRWEKEKCK
jgi:hypothetical protein